jgi:hypothetical protein
VGGGYALQQPLADLALTWMIQEARAAGLNVRESAVPAADHMAEITRTHEKFLFGTYKWFSGPRPRPIMKLIAQEKELEYRNQDTDPTVAKRLDEDWSYHRTHDGLRRLAGVL